MKNKYRLIITIITIFIFLFTTIGYAVYGARVTTQGSVYFGKNGEIAITNVTLTSNNNLQNPEDPTFTKDSINFNLNFNVPSNSALDDEYSATYSITISNTSFYDYEFASAVFNPSIETTNNPNMNVLYELSGIEVGETIPELSTKTFSITIYMYPTTPGDYNVSGDTNVNVTEEDEEPTGNLLGSIPSNSSVNLRGSTVRDKVVLTVINTYETTQSFDLSISNSNFKLVNANGNNLGTLTVGANNTQTYDIYIERKNGVSFATNQQNVNLTFITANGNTSLGSVKVLVDKDETLLDSEPPIISNVNATFVAENGKVNLTWDATDINNITDYVVDTCDSSNNCSSQNTSSSNTSFTVTGLSNGTYYFKVYGIDSKGNNGKNKATDCTTSSGYCSRSTSSTYTWVFDVTYNLTNISKSGADTAVIGTQYTATLSVSGNYNLPNSITINMNGNNLTSGYSYNSNNGRITINNVTGPITITARATGGGICLVEGTKVLLNNGRYKNIEDINYNDLLSVWSYDTGSLIPEYPIWIEKTSSINKYQHTIFSDGSELNTVGYHGIFSKTHNEFISVDDYSKFKVGTEVYKVINGRLKEVSIKKIEFINKEVNYYHVVSTRYYNIIANDFLTTDGTVILSNLYGFDKNVTWPKEYRNNLINNKNNLYSYNEFSDIMPYYMFNGLRAEEGKILERYGLDKTTFKVYLLNNQMNKNMLLEVPKNNKGKRLWEVTTDKDNNLNVNILYEEGSYYILPKVLGVRYWYSTSEDKYYKPLDKVKVNHSMHFISK